jgi:hypothetical protein
MKIKFQADADFNQTIIQALQRREPAIDFRTADEAQLRSSCSVTTRMRKTPVSQFIASSFCLAQSVSERKRPQPAQRRSPQKAA